MGGEEKEEEVEEGGGEGYGEREWEWEWGRGATRAGLRVVVCIPCGFSLEVLGVGLLPFAMRPVAVGRRGWLLAGIALLMVWLFLEEVGRIWEEGAAEEAYVGGGGCERKGGWYIKKEGRCI